MKGAIKLKKRPIRFGYHVGLCCCGLDTANGPAQLLQEIGLHCLQLVGLVVVGFCQACLLSWIPFIIFMDRNSIFSLSFVYLFVYFLSVNAIMWALCTVYLPNFCHVLALFHRYEHVLFLFAISI